MKNSGEHDTDIAFRNYFLLLSLFLPFEILASFLIKINVMGVRYIYSFSNKL